MAHLQKGPHPCHEIALQASDLWPYLPPLPSFIPTIGVEYKSKKLPIGSDNVEIQLFDTAGQERFRVMTASYYRQGAGVFIVYDVTSKDTFDNVKQWVEQIDRTFLE